MCLYIVTATEKTNIFFSNDCVYIENILDENSNKVFFLFFFLEKKIPNFEQKYDLSRIPGMCVTIMASETTTSHFWFY